MPGMDGFHLLNTLTASPLVQLLRIIVVTSLDEAQIAEQGSLPEGVVTIHKPVQTSVLVAVVRAFFDGWKIQRQTLG
jgi:response regulator RpfG family c-di-GMP phosphodiesterase